ncbi:hypothetical protein CK203_022650 [Vitis vinifera]|uniref:Uncharacterized protein n=1 Tax=Vitis vinifera TaxID=29760 RepID=A0A438JE84_VITVI|nr:hypothetical protein CK203_022650 [Vitis vinifera]
MFLQTGNSGFLHPRTGIHRENLMDETQLSLGDLYVQKEGNVPKRSPLSSANIQKNGAKQLQRSGRNPRRNLFSDCKGKYDRAKGNLPHWLREAITTPPPRLAEPPLPTVGSSGAHSGMYRVTQNYSNPIELHSGPRGRMNSRFGDLRMNDLQAILVMPITRTSHQEQGLEQLNQAASAHVEAINQAT